MITADQQSQQEQERREREEYDRRILVLAHQLRSMRDEAPQELATPTPRIPAQPMTQEEADRFNVSVEAAIRRDQKQRIEGRKYPQPFEEEYGACGRSIGYHN